jgi:hypothetical protein
MTHVIPGVFGLGPSSCFLKTRERFFRPQVRDETPALLDPLENADLNHWTTHVSIITAI